MGGPHPEIPRANREPMSNFPVDLKIGLLGIGDFAVVLDHTRTSSARWRAGPCDELVRNLTGGDQGGRRVCRKEECWRPSQRAWRQLVRNPRRCVCTLPDSRQRLPRNYYRPLRLSDKQERQVVAIIE